MKCASTGSAGRSGLIRSKVPRSLRAGRSDTGSVDVQVVRYRDRPGLWDSIAELSAEVWPEYNLQGEVLGQYWEGCLGQCTSPARSRTGSPGLDRPTYPETADYIFPRGLATVRIDRDADAGEYWEPNIW
jgi:hypothetical protein